jgi:type I restriction enzyme M protein
MLGAIIGDIVGSIYEFRGIKVKNFLLLSKRSFYTDDTIMTVAVGNALMEAKDDLTLLRQSTIKWMKFLAKIYPAAGYGSKFKYWVFEENPKPYNSFGNGAGMRVSACGIVAKSLEETIELSRAVTDISHNHPEGIKAAEAIATSVYLLRQGKDKVFLKKYIQDHYYPLNFTLNEIRPTYSFNERAQDSTPQAIVAFLESTSFEDAIRNAVSLGGDADTLAAMAGALAAEHYGIPKNFIQPFHNKLDSLLKGYVDRFHQHYPYRLEGGK